MAKKRKNTSAQSDTNKRPLIFVLLVVIETLLSVALRIDKRLRQQVYPLVEDHAVWCIRTYLPHVVIYVSFTPQGILLDSKLPDNMGEPDVTVSGSLMAVMRSVLSSDERAINKLQFRGDAESAKLSRDLLANMGLQQTITNILGRLRQLTGASEIAPQQNLITTYKKQLTVQHETIDQLKTELADNQKHITSQRRKLTLAIASSGILLLTVIGLVITHYF